MVAELKKKNAFQQSTTISNPDCSTMEINLNKIQQLFFYALEKVQKGHL